MTIAAATLATSTGGTGTSTTVTLITGRSTGDRAGTTIIHAIIIPRDGETVGGVHNFNGGIVWQKNPNTLMTT